MLYISIAIVILGGMALYGYTMWLDRVHPAPNAIGDTEKREMVEVKAKLERLSDDLQEIKLGNAFAGRKPRVDQEDI